MTALTFDRFAKFVNESLVSTRLSWLVDEFEEAVHDQKRCMERYSREEFDISEIGGVLFYRESVGTDYYNLGWLAALEDGLREARQRQAEVAWYMVTAKSDKQFVSETLSNLLAKEFANETPFFSDKGDNADFRQGRIDGLMEWLEEIDPEAARTVKRPVRQSA